MDFYTFKTEFQKSTSPDIPKCLVPDYLKINYYRQALLIVKEIEGYNPHSGR